MMNKKRKLVGLMLILLSACSYGQQIKVVGKDTFAILPINNVRKANEKSVELSECKEQRDSMYSAIRTYQGMTNNLRSEITSLKTASDLDKRVIGDKQAVIELSDKELKKNARNVKLLKTERLGLVGIIAVLVVKILLF